jgi:hypothetical protein
MSEFPWYPNLTEENVTSAALLEAFAACRRSPRR